MGRVNGQRSSANGASTPKKPSVANIFRNARHGSFRVPKWVRQLGFARRMLVVILGLSLAAAAAIMIISVGQLNQIAHLAVTTNTVLGETASSRSREALVTRAEADLALIARSQANFYNAILNRIQDDLRSMAVFMTELYANPELFTGEIPPQPDHGPIAQFHLPAGISDEADVAAERHLISNAYWLFRNVLTANPALSAVYVGTQYGWVFRFMEPTDLDPNYDPRLRAWYQEALLPENAGQVIWTDIYIDAFTGDLINSAVMSFSDPAGTPLGVVGVDMLLRYILDDLTKLRIGTSGFSFLLNQYGNVIADTRFDPDDPVEHQLDWPEYLVEDIDVRLHEFGEHRYYLAMARLPATGWMLGIAVSYGEIMLDAAQMDIDITAQSEATLIDIESQIQRTLWIFLFLLASVFSLVFIAANWSARALARPLSALVRGATQVGAGDLDTQIPVESADEIGMVATSFNQMTSDLKTHISELAEAVEERTRISSDLAVATEIQEAFLPRIAPLFSGHDDFDIAALMQPAKEVGGDFYDFFFLDKEQTKLALVIADVSGKSVPAALVMVIAKTLIRNNIDLSPADLLESANTILCEDNYSNMFVTTFYAILDLATGVFTCASAGHTKPLIYRQLSDTVDVIAAPKAPPLGVIPGRKYAQEELTLTPGDTVLLYTDGVSEAFNPQQQMFGTDRLANDLLDSVAQPAAVVVDRIRQQVHAFAAGEPQSDDIALLYVKYLGAGSPFGVT